MSSCPQNPQLQAYLDGELGREAETALRRHLVTCAECASELALYEQLFATLASEPLLEPSPQLTERIMERVLPSQVRRRWVRRLGWGYGVAAAGSAAAAVALLLSPAPRTLLGALGVEASQRLAQAAVFVVNALAVALVQLATGWGLIEELGVRISPLVRAITALLSRPGVDVTLGLATAASVLLVWWLRPRELAPGRNRGSRGIDHAGFFAF